MNSTKILFLLLVSVLCFSGKKKERPFFPFFDEAVLYHSDLDFEEIMLMRSKAPAEQSPDDAIYIFLFSRDYPMKLKDKDFVPVLEKRYSKLLLNAAKTEELRKLFVKTGKERTTEKACIPVYRDILLLKKKGKLVALAKICFQCEQYFFLGDKAGSESFGADGEFEKLAFILRDEITPNK
jgi:hypothetical protein